MYWFQWVDPCPPRAYRRGRAQPKEHVMVARSRRAVATVAAVGSLALAVVGTVVLTNQAQAATGLPYQDATQPVATRVADLLSRMSLDDKVGQMTQASK